MSTAVYNPNTEVSSLLEARRLQLERCERPSLSLFDFNVLQTPSVYYPAGLLVIRIANVESCYDGYEALYCDKCGG